MGLSSDLISQLVKATKNDKPTNEETSVYGTIVKYENKKYVKLDGSDLLTPVSSTTAINDGDRVIVTIKNHTATVTGNTSDPSASGKEVIEIGDKITDFEIVIADKVSTKEFDAQVGRIDDLVSDNILVKDKLTANSADIDELKAKDVEITGSLNANKAEIDELKTSKLDADVADLKYATIEKLEATDANIHNLEVDYGEFKRLSTDKFEATDAVIEKLDTTYANIDFSNIGKAAIEQFYATSGIIKDLVIGDQTITGELVGVTIKGDLIEGNTIVADKLVIKGSDGLYYKLNTDGMTTEAEQTEYNSLNGSVIQAKSITATKIDVKDLVAFDATIGGFKIGEKSIYSGVKESVDNATRGIYLDSDGQISIGDTNNFLKYYKDQNGDYRLEISAKSLSFGTSSGGGSSSNLEDVIGGIQNDVDSLRDEITTLLRIESSRGTVFKNDHISTVLSAVIYHGTQRITDSATMKSVFGDGAYLQWKWQRLDEESYGIISSDDKRFGDNGFTFTLSPEDVDTKVTFMCELIT